LERIFLRVSIDAGPDTFDDPDDEERLRSRAAMNVDDNLLTNSSNTKKSLVERSRRRPRLARWSLLGLDTTLSLPCPRLEAIFMGAQLRTDMTRSKVVLLCFNMFRVHSVTSRAVNGSCKFYVRPLVVKSSRV
jgi:hypothetical protein